MNSNRKKEKYYKILLFLIGFTFLVSFTKMEVAAVTATAPATTNALRKLSLNNIAMYAGDKKTITLNYGSEKTVWSSSNNKVVSVSKKKGTAVTIQAKKKGTVKIKAKLDGLTYVCKVKVLNVSLSETSLTAGTDAKYSISFNGGDIKKAKVVTVKELKKKKKKNVLYWAIGNAAYGSLKLIGTKQVVYIPKKFTSKGNYVKTVIYAKLNGKTLKCPVTLWKQVYNNVPAYWTGELSKSITSYNKFNSGNVAKFLYITDTHWNVNAQYSDDIAKYLVKKLGLPFTIFGGDIITLTHSNFGDAITEIKSFVNAFSGINVISTTGNHDRNGGGSQGVSSAQLYNLMYSQQTSYANVSNSGQTIYRDDSARKIRYISFFFDACSKADPVIKNWIKSRITELPSGWTVALFSHAYWNTDKTVNSYSTDLANFLLGVEDVSKADVGFWMVGHVHSDRSTTITSSKGSKILIVSTDRDSYLDGGLGSDGIPRFGGNKMKKGTSTEQILELAEIDAKNRKLYLTRVGAGKDRSFSY